MTVVEKAEINRNFENAGRDNPVALGTCQRFATLLAGHPSASIIGLEDSTSGKDLDIIIGLNGPASKPEDFVRTNVDVLKGAHEWAQIRAQPQLEQIQKLVDRVSALVNSPLPYVHKHGALTNSGLG